MKLSGLDFLTTAYSLTTTTTDDIDTLDEFYRALTTASSITATIAPYHIDVNITNDYMSSLSDTELVQLKEKIEEKQLVMVEEIEAPKVYKKV